VSFQCNVDPKFVERYKVNYPGKFNPVPLSLIGISSGAACGCRTHLT